MIIPIGHEQNTVHRHPWVTYSIMILCVVAFLSTHFATQSRVQDSVRLLSEAIEYYLEHPYLELDPRLAEVLGGDFVVSELQEELGVQGAPDGEFVALEQTELDGLTEAGFDALNDTPQRRWGLVPSDFSVVSLITHMFMHAGWLHLIGNLLFLYLSAPFLEDEWGRPFFAGFYLISGIVAAIFFSVMAASFRMVSI